MKELSGSLELNSIYQMDNLKLMKKIQSETIDLIYCDILYNTGRKFKDYNDDLGTIEEAIEWYKPRMLEMYRVLKNTGSIYLHMDYRLSHYIKIELDKIFKVDNFRNEIIWSYTSVGKSHTYANNHDVILYYSKSNTYTYNQQYIITESKENRIKKYKFTENDKEYFYQGRNLKDNPYNKLIRDKEFVESNNLQHLFTIKENKGTRVGTVWFDIKKLKGNSKEVVNYDTQKPKSLLERIIKTSSNPNDVVADFFCGSGTTVVVSKELGRNFIGCDINPKSIDLTNERLKEIIK